MEPFFAAFWKVLATLGAAGILGGVAHVIYTKVNFAKMEGKLELLNASDHQQEESSTKLESRLERIESKLDKIGQQLARNQID